MTALHGRRLGSLLGAWAGALLIAALLYWVEASIPALIDILTPVYVILAVVMLVVTWKWFRSRGGDQDRRRTDRRHVDRRHLPPDPPPHRAHHPS